MNSKLYKTFYSFFSKLFSLREFALFFPKQPTEKIQQGVHKLPLKHPGEEFESISVQIQTKQEYVGVSGDFDEEITDHKTGV